MPLFTIQDLTPIPYSRFDTNPLKKGTSYHLTSPCFLKEDLFEKIEQACEILSEEYLEAGDKEGSEETLKNRTIALSDAVPEFDPFRNLLTIQKSWQEMMKYTGNERKAIFSCLQKS